MDGKVILAILIGYGLGSIQSAYFLGRLVGKIDIREHGSGNAGASNITATLGLPIGAAVGFVDLLKGFIAVQAVHWLYPGDGNLAYLAGLMSILGHIFPFYLKFRGGKGVAALVGMMFGVSWKLGLVFVALLAIPALLTDYIVAGSFGTFIALPIATHLLDYPMFLTLIGLILTALCFYLHRANIQRIIAGEELKISAVLFKKKAE